MRLPREDLDAERLRGRQLYETAMEWLQGAGSRSDDPSLANSSEFIALIVGSIPEVVNVTRLSLRALERHQAYPANTEGLEDLIHVLRWQLCEALLRCLSLEQPPGVTWVVLFDRLVDTNEDARSSAPPEPHGGQPTAPRPTLGSALNDLVATAMALEQLVDDRGPTTNLGAHLQDHYIAALDALAAMERSIRERIFASESA